MYEITSDGISPSASREETYRWLLKTYPLSVLDVTADTLTIEDYDFSDRSGGGCGPDWSALLGDLAEMVDTAAVYHYGMLDPAVPHAACSGADGVLVRWRPALSARVPTWAASPWPTRSAITWDAGTRTAAAPRAWTPTIPTRPAGSASLVSTWAIPATRSMSIHQGPPTL